MSVWPGMSALTTIISSKIAKSIGVLSSIAYLLPSNVRLSGLAYTTPSYIRTIALSSGLPTGAEFGGTENIFADQDFWMTFFSEKSSHFQAQNFWWPFFSHWSGFTDFPYLYCVKCRIWPFLHKKNHYFRKEFLDDTFFILCSYLCARPTTQHYFSKYWGDGCMDRPPPQILGGPLKRLSVGLLQRRTVRISGRKIL